MRHARLIVLLGCLLALPAVATASPPDGGDADDPAAAPDAAERSALEETRRFIAAGGDPGAEVPDKDVLLGHAAMNVTRLHAAVESGYTSVARYLVEHGANPRASADSKSHFNELTPIDVARETGAHELAELLKQYHVHKMWYESGDEELTQVSLDADHVITTWSEPPLPKPDLLIRVKVPEVRAAPGAAVASAGGAAYASLAALPDGTTWGEKLSPADTLQGRTFLVKSRSGHLFKVLLAHIDPERRHLTVSFADLVRASREDEVVRDVVAEFQSALRDGRLAAAANLCTPEMARSLRDAANASLSVRPAMRRVRHAKAEGDTATVVVFERRATDAGSADVLITFALRRTGPSWRIQSMRSAPAGAEPGESPDGGGLDDDEI